MDISRKLLPIGTILNRYRIESILGVGGFGVTYLAIEPVQQSYVAIKEYFPKRFASRHIGNTILSNRSVEDRRVFKWGLKRFLDEAKVLARLDHPNIIKVQKYFELHGTAYLVMDYCDGKPLDKFVEDGFSVSPRRIFQIYTSLINALEHVHSHGIIHGDLKPSNILVRIDGEPILLDFGSARQEMLRIAVGQVSDGYSPPEFYDTADKVGPWSDIYGLGATFYKLITGVKVPVATNRTKSDTYIPSVLTVTNGYSYKFLELIDSSLRVSCSLRPQSISSLRKSLPDIASFNKQSNVVKVSRLDTSLLGYSSTTASEPNLIKIGIFLCVLTLLVLGVVVFNQPPAQVQPVEPIKVSPILIEELSTITDSPEPYRKNSAQVTNGNQLFHQSLSFLVKVSTSNEISMYSIPQSDVAIRSFRVVESEIEKHFGSALDKKEFTQSENSRDYLFNNFTLTEINSFTYAATNVKCSTRSIGPKAIECKKSGRDLICQFTLPSAKYEHICLASFS